MAQKTSKVVPNRKFRNAMNSRYTRQLFHEQTMRLADELRTVEPIYTLWSDVPGLINFGKEYVKDRDPTGLRTATRLLEDYSHWELLMKCTWFREQKKEWDKELAAVFEQEATDVLRKVMKGGEEIKISEQLTAAKAILGKAKALQDKNTPKNARGRPSSDEVKGELVRATQLEKELQQDAERILAAPLAAAIKAV